MTKITITKDAMAKLAAMTTTTGDMTMTNELVKQWDEYVESMGSVMGDVEHMTQQMRDRIEQLTGEVQRWQGMFDEKHNLMLEHKARAEKAEAEHDRLRALLWEADLRIAWEAVGFGNDFADQVQAALKGETS